MIFTLEQLRGHLDRFEHEERGGGFDRYEVDRFLAWLEDQFGSPVAVVGAVEAVPRIITRVMDDGINTKDGCA